MSEIKILGFQAADLLQIDENIKHSYFIYPDDNVGCIPATVLFRS